MSRDTYQVTVRREDPWWVAIVDGVGATETRTIATLDQTVRDLIVVARDLEDLADFDLTWSYDLPPGAASALTDYQKSREAYKAAEQRYEETAEQAAVSLGRTGVSVRDAAQLMHISYQRVSQLRTKSKPRRASR